VLFLELMATAKPYHIYPGKLPSWVLPPYQMLIEIGYAFVAYPNRDSTVYKERYHIPEAETIIRGVSCHISPFFTSGISEEGSNP
jgi:saccharopine dehydrogenase (NADP+, L-glutamate forming)